MEPSRSTALEELPTPSAPKRFELPWLILGALLISTVWGAWQTSVQQTAEARARFAELAVHERTEIEERLGEMRELTASVAALVAALPGVDSAAWNRFFDSRDKGGSRRPGLIGFQYLPPQGSRLPQLERRLDGTSGAQRPWAAHAKIGPLLELRNVQLSEPILDGTELGLKSAGYALAVPVAAERGHVVALIDFAALARGGKRADQGIALEVRDGSAVLYRSGDAARTASPSMQSESRIAFAGRPLTLTAASTPALELRLANNTPRTVLLIGLVSCALLAGLIWLLSRLRDQATAMAERMTRQLHEQTRFTEELIEFNPNPIFRKDAAGRLISVNRAWEQLAGRARESVLGKRYAQFLPESAAAAIESHDAAVLASPSGRAVIEAPFVNAEGRQFETIIAKQALSDRDGRVSGLIGTLTDVTQIKELEHALAQQREQLDLVIRSSQQGIWDIQDIVGAKPYFSERFMEIVGYQPQDFPDAYEWRDVVHPDDQVEFQKNLMQLLRRQVDLFDVETRLRCKNGEYTWVRARGIAQYATNGRVSRFTGSITDISDRKRAEQDLLAANERVTEAARAKEAFLAMMSHEMRTPLNGVLGMASLLGETSLDDEQKDYIRLIRASGDTLLRLIDDVLDFSKIESGHMTLEALPVELVPLIEEAFELVADKARGKHLALLFDFDDSAPYFVVGDATRIRQILLNLLANAIKFTEEGEIGVRVTASPTRDGRIRVEIAVSDTGIGIPADRLDQLFQPFTQVDASTTRKYGGTGLGLAICRRLTQLMGGDIRAESREGKGSTFIATIVSELARGPIQPYMQRNVAEFTGKRLLVVDQSPRRREIMGRRYRIWGLDTVVASHEEAAEVLSARGPFDILLSDTVLPTPEATALAEALDAEDRRRDAAGAPHIVSILASMQVRTELAQRQLVPKLRHDFFVIRPIGRTRMFDLLLHAAL
ncbi:MAG TPA: ATP-binding protein, partial [Usitatibacteraceae bacterium]|nr:ATP-binding protein [Usitatibacteraceae bacterium]